MYTDYIMESVRQNLGLDHDDTSKDSLIAEMDKDEILDRVATWNNLINFGSSIRSWVEDIWGIDLSAIEEAKKLASRTKSTAEYVAATVGMAADPSGPEWQKVHRGRAKSSVSQLDYLAKQAKAFLDLFPEKKGTTE